LSAEVGNAMHILPLFLREDSSQFYECPSDFFYSDRHTIFTRDFESIHMVLTTATIYYYGIDTKTYEPKVTMLSTHRLMITFISTTGYWTVT